MGISPKIDKNCVALIPGIHREVRGRTLSHNIMSKTMVKASFQLPRDHVKPATSQVSKSPCAYHLANLTRTSIPDLYISYCLLNVLMWPATLLLQ